MTKDPSAAVPLWCRAADPGPRVVDLRCCISRPPGWNAAPAFTQLPGVVQGLWRGSDARDALVVSFMPNAVPGHRMLNWIEASLAMCGFPEPAMRPTLELAHWESEATPAALAARLKTDELHLLRGLARAESGTARLYAVLARRRSHAWKLFLSLASAAGGGNELAHLHDDDSRAGTVFGSLELEGPE